MLDLAFMYLSEADVCHFSPSLQKIPFFLQTDIYVQSTSSQMFEDFVVRKQFPPLQTLSLQSNPQNVQFWSGFS